MSAVSDVARSAEEPRPLLPLSPRRRGLPACDPRLTVPPTSMSAFSPGGSSCGSDSASGGIASAALASMTPLLAAGTPSAEGTGALSRCQPGPGGPTAAETGGSSAMPVTAASMTAPAAYDVGCWDCQFKTAAVRG